MRAAHDLTQLAPARLGHMTMLSFVDRLQVPTATLYMHRALPTREARQRIGSWSNLLHGVLESARFASKAGVHPERAPALEARSKAWASRFDFDAPALRLHSKSTVAISWILQSKGSAHA